MPAWLPAPSNKRSAVSRHAEPRPRWCGRRRSTSYWRIPGRPKRRPSSNTKMHEHVRGSCGRPVADPLAGQLPTQPRAPRRTDRQSHRGGSTNRAIVAWVGPLLRRQHAQRDAMLRRSPADRRSRCSCGRRRTRSVHASRAVARVRACVAGRRVQRQRQRSAARSPMFAATDSVHRDTSRRVTPAAGGGRRADARPTSAPEGARPSLRPKGAWPGEPNTLQATRLWFDCCPIPVRA
jgi:hypothetical protein